MKARLDDDEGYVRQQYSTATPLSHHYLEHYIRPDGGQMVISKHSVREMRESKARRRRAVCASTVQYGHAAFIPLFGALHSTRRSTNGDKEILGSRNA